MTTTADARHNPRAERLSVAPSDDEVARAIAALIPDAPEIPDSVITLLRAARRAPAR